MQKILNKVKEFHRVFMHPVATTPTLTVNHVLRHKLMEEENSEYLEAAENDDLIEIADALGDQLYILCGTILAHGMQDIIEPVFEEIHNSNMSKLGEDGNPVFREDGKIIKGPNYFRPNLSKFIK